MKPIIYILDIDGTIIGDITHQVMVYDIINSIKASNPKFNHNIKDFQQTLRDGMIRPYFSDFIKQISYHQPNAEFFIYTASQTKWAEFLVKNIEKALSIKINRPLFTRKDCMYINGELQKSTHKIINKIKGTLRKKYNNIPINEMISSNNIIIVDNNRVFPGAFDNQRLIQCPTYSFKIPENLPATFSKSLFESNYKHFYEIFQRYNINIPITSNYMRFQRFFYQYYVNELAKYAQPTDKFWHYLKEIIIRKNITSFDDQSIKYINNKIQSFRY